jgi:hypothetical protein
MHAVKFVIDVPDVVPEALSFAGPALKSRHVRPRWTLAIARLDGADERIPTRGRMPTLIGAFGRLALSRGRSTLLSLMDRLAGPGLRCLFTSDLLATS